MSAGVIQSETNPATHELSFGERIVGGAATVAGVGIMLWSLKESIVNHWDYDAGLALLGGAVLTMCAVKVLKSKPNGAAMTYAEFCDYHNALVVEPMMSGEDEKSGHRQYKKLARNYPHHALKLDEEIARIPDEFEEYVDRMATRAISDSMRERLN